MALGNEVVAKNDPEDEDNINNNVEDVAQEDNINNNVEDEEEGGGGDMTQEEEEDEDEEDLIDPLDTLRTECEAQDAAMALHEKLVTCNERVGSRKETEETCQEEMMDYVHKIDHCVSHTLFEQLK